MRLLALLIVLLVLSAGFATAQDEGIRDYDLPTVVGTFKATQVGVDEMRYIGTEYINREDSALMRYVTMVLQRDIDFYADFDLVPLDSFYLRTYEIKELDLLGWRRLGAEYVVRLDAEFPGPNLRVYWRIYHVNTQMEVSKSTLEYGRAFWREMAHDIANDIVYTLTGDQGIFRTKIAYVRRKDNTKELYIADYDGNNERRVTNTGSTNISPVFSPDGTDLYFTSFLDGDPGLYKVKIETGKIKKIAQFPGIVAAPSISPDGQKIACVLSKDGNSEIYVLDTLGNVIKRLTNHRAIESSPSWSPDGRHLCFSSDRTGAPQVYIMDADGLSVRRLTYEGGYNDSPIWSDRGDRVTFVSRTPSRRFDLASIDTSGVDYRILTVVGHNENPHFAPDGKHIIFSSSRLSEGDIFTMDLNGRNQRRVTRTGDVSNPVWGPIR